VLFSIVPGLRAARRIGVAERREKRGDLPGVMSVCSEALTILRAPQVDLAMPWCRSAASVALWGYCRAARELDRTNELLETLTRWRPTYLAWLKSPDTEDEAQYLKWFEQIFSALNVETEERR
jgi:hypothetical protein